MIIKVREEMRRTRKTVNDNMIEQLTYNRNEEKAGINEDKKIAGSLKNS